MTPAQSTPDAPLTTDLPCAQCHYNLRTKRPSELCPECAHSVADSIAEHHENLKVFHHPLRAALASYLLGATSFFLGLRYQFGQQAQVLPNDNWIPYLRASLIPVAFALFAFAERKNLFDRRGIFTRVPLLLLGLTFGVSILFSTDPRNQISQVLDTLAMLSLICFIAPLIRKMRSFPLAIFSAIILVPGCLYPTASIVWNHFAISYMRRSRTHPVLQHWLGEFFDVRGLTYLAATTFFLFLAALILTPKRPTRQQ